MHDHLQLSGGQRRGNARLTDEPALVGRWPCARIAVHVDITALITNCPRYIPRMQRLEGSRYVPEATTGQQAMVMLRDAQALGELANMPTGQIDVADVIERSTKLLGAAADLSAQNPMGLISAAEIKALTRDPGDQVH